MAAYRRVYDLRHLPADFQEPGSAPEPYEYELSLPFLLARGRQQRVILHYNTVHLMTTKIIS